MKTYVYENAVVLTAVIVGAHLSGGRDVDWVSAAAVFCGFCHASIADRMIERELRRPISEVPCAWKATYYWLAKEALWVAAFIMLRAWPALIGCGVFLVYPIWRKAYRRWRPIDRGIS